MVYYHFDLKDASERHGAWRLRPVDVPSLPARLRLTVLSLLSERAL
jgi:hypothetical protein